MNADAKDLILQATKCLRLRDILLLSSKFERPDVPDDSQEATAHQQHMRKVTYFQDEEAKDEKIVNLLQIQVDLGTRVVSEKKAKSDKGKGKKKVFFIIEAKYLVEYEVKDDISDDALKAFSEYNAVHNVWPFWRQHVYDIVQRGRLPHLNIPLYAGMKM